MLSFHGDPAIKAKYIARVEEHARLDRIVQGQGWKDDDDGVSRGCAIGCTLENYDHSRYPIELGVPVELARLEDRIFESLPADEAKQWPGAVLRAIPVGRNLSLVWPQFALWLLRGLPEVSLKRNDVKAAVNGVIALYERWVESAEKPADVEWFKARVGACDAACAACAAYDAASDAASDAAYDAAADAAYAAAAAYAADAAAAYAAAAYAAYATRSEPRRAFWRSAADELLRLLEAS